MQKRPDRARSWFGPNPLVLLLLIPLLALVWLFRGEPAVTTLGYGELKHLLQAPGLRFRDVKVSRGEIRGKLYFEDQLSGADLAKLNEKREKDPDVPPPGHGAISFRTARQGLELDDGLQRLLEQNVGPGYQSDDDDTTGKSIISFLFFGMMMVCILVLALFLIRWMSGGQNPFQFGRSRHKLYAQKE